MVILDMHTFLEDGVATEAGVLDKVASFDWDSLRGKAVLVKGCGTDIIPPWAFMLITARLTEVARQISYGNEHSAMPIFTRVRQETTGVKP